MRVLGETERRAMKLILRTIKWTLTEALESELNIAPIYLRLEELQRMEAIKILPKNHQNKYKKNNNGKQTTPLMHLASLCK